MCTDNIDFLFYQPLYDFKIREVYAGYDSNEAATRKKFLEENGFYVEQYNEVITFGIFRHVTTLIIDNPEGRQVPFGIPTK